MIRGRLQPPCLPLRPRSRSGPRWTPSSRSPQTDTPTKRWCGTSTSDPPESERTPPSRPPHTHPPPVGGGAFFCRRRLGPLGLSMKALLSTCGTPSSSTTSTSKPFCSIAASCTSGAPSTPLTPSPSTAATHESGRPFGSAPLHFQPLLTIPLFFSQGDTKRVHNNLFPTSFFLTASVGRHFAVRIPNPPFLSCRLMQHGVQVPKHIMVNRDTLNVGQDPEGFIEKENYVEYNGGDPSFSSPGY